MLIPIIELAQIDISLIIIVQRETTTHIQEERVQLTGGDSL